MGETDGTADGYVGTVTAAMACAPRHVLRHVFWVCLGLRLRLGLRFRLRLRLGRRLRLSFGLCLRLGLRIAPRFLQIKERGNALRATAGGPRPRPHKMLRGGGGGQGKVP